MRRWDENIKADLKSAEWEGVDWINLAQETAFVNTIIRASGSS